MERQNESITSDETAITTADGNGPATNPSTDGLVVSPLPTAAALNPSVLGKVSATEALPATWVERACKARKYYIEEPLVKNCVNSWRTFVVDDEIKITSDDENVKNGAASPADQLSIFAFVKDMIVSGWRILPHHWLEHMPRSEGITIRYSPVHNLPAISGKKSTSCHKKNRKKYFPARNRE